MLEKLASDFPINFFIHLDIPLIDMLSAGNVPGIVVSRGLPLMGSHCDVNTEGLVQSFAALDSGVSTTFWVFIMRFHFIPNSIFFLSSPLSLVGTLTPPPN